MLLSVNLVLLTANGLKRARSYWMLGLIVWMMAAWLVMSILTLLKNGPVISHRYRVVLVL